MGKKRGSEIVSRNEVAAQFAQSVPREFSALKQDSVNRNVE